MSYDTLSLAALTKAGLVPDWQTVFVGWRGIPGEWGVMRLPGADVQQFAADCLTGEADADYLLVRVLDAERLEREEVVLRALAARSGVDERTARRKWRYAAMRDMPQDVVLPPPDAERDAYVDAAYTWYDAVTTFWLHWCRAVPEYPLPDVTFEVPPGDSLMRVRAWLTDERAALGLPPAPAPAK